MKAAKPSIFLAWALPVAAFAGTGCLVILQSEHPWVSTLTPPLGLEKHPLLVGFCCVLGICAATAVAIFRLTLQELATGHPKKTWVKFRAECYAAAGLLSVIGSVVIGAATVDAWTDQVHEMGNAAAPKMTVVFTDCNARLERNPNKGMPSTSKPAQQASVGHDADRAPRAVNVSGQQPTAPFTMYCESSQPAPAPPTRDLVTAVMAVVIFSLTGCAVATKLAIAWHEHQNSKETPTKTPITDSPGPRESSPTPNPQSPNFPSLPAILLVGLALFCFWADSGQGREK
jgi:hypothetical protein